MYEDMRVFISPLLALLAIAGWLGQVQGQQPSLSIAASFPCKAATEFFDISSLECRACDQVSIASGTNSCSMPMPAEHKSTAVPALHEQLESVCFSNCISRTKFLAPSL
jgi:hypothetical protein